MSTREFTEWDPALTERAAAVQRGGRDVADDAVELSAPTGAGHLHPPQMVVEIYLAVLQPYRVM
jgi:hypothetical protein